MGNGISEVLTFAIGVAISPVPIIAVILMLFSQRARVNGPVFLLGWVLALAAVSGVAYTIADQSNPSTTSSAADTISWGKIVLGVLFLLLALRQWRNRPAADTEPEMPKWMAGVDALSPGKALGLGLLLAGVNPKNLILTLGAAAGLAQLGLSTSDAVVSLIVFVRGRDRDRCQHHDRRSGRLLPARRRDAKAKLDELEDWLALHNAAVMAVLFLVFGVDLIAKGLPPVT